MEAPRRTAVVTLRRDLNAEMLALSRVTREALTLSAMRTIQLERRQRLLVIGICAVAAYAVLRALGL